MFVKGLLGRVLVGAGVGSQVLTAGGGRLLGVLALVVGSEGVRSLVLLRCLETVVLLVAVVLGTESVGSRRSMVRRQVLVGCGTREGVANVGV